MKPPVNGSEITFKIEPWKTNGKRSNNCYAYAVNDYKGFRLSKSIPGERSGTNKGFHSYTHCKDLDRRVIADNPGKVYKAKAMDKCKPGFFKIMMVVAPSNKYGNATGDFHFYKQHSMAEYVVQPGDTYASIARMFDVPYSRILKAGQRRPIRPRQKLKFKLNLFSHKMGWGTGPLIKDACGKPIKDPRTACRKYGYNYSKYCGSFCVKNRGINVGNRYSKVGQNRAKTL
jgi:LysM repeat protein